MQFSYQLLHDLQDGTCFYCRKKLGAVKRGPDTPRGFTRDHFFPKSMGHKFTGNMVLCCNKCNLKKGSHLPSPSEVVYYHSIWSQIDGGCAIDLEEFLFTQKCITLLQNLVGPPVDTRHII